MDSKAGAQKNRSIDGACLLEDGAATATATAATTTTAAELELFFGASLYP